jgi:hypothetical protein
MSPIFSFAGSKKGFALLIALLITSVVLSVGVVLANITYKQALLSSTSNESLKAFYAADAAMECALYWDIHYNDTVRGAPSDVSGALLSNPLFPTYTYPRAGTTPASYAAYDATHAAYVTCYGQTLGIDNFTTSATPSGKVTFPAKPGGVFGFLYFDNNPATWVANSKVSCAQVDVSKGWTDVNGSNTQDPGEVTTRIEVRGFSSCDFNSARQVERTIVQQYCGLASCPPTP